MSKRGTVISQKRPSWSRKPQGATKVASAELDSKCLSTLGIMYGGGKSQLFSLFQLSVKASKYSRQGFTQRLQNRVICLVLKELNLSMECDPQRTSAAAKISGLSM